MTTDTVNTPLREQRFTHLHRERLAAARAAAQQLHLFAGQEAQFTEAVQGGGIDPLRGAGIDGEHGAGGTVGQVGKAGRRHDGRGGSA